LLWVLAIPAAITWGLLAFITNYIPNIGFVIGLIPPAILALLEGGPARMLLVIALYCVVNFVIQSVIQPKFVGDSVGLSGTVTMFSLVFWATVLGALGALLAIPLTLARSVIAGPGGSPGPLAAARARGPACKGRGQGVARSRRRG
jgi:AI-2 transport protein TqsA